MTVQKYHLVLYTIIIVAKLWLCNVCIHDCMYRQTSYKKYANNNLLDAPSYYEINLTSTDVKKHTYTYVRLGHKHTHLNVINFE